MRFNEFHPAASGFHFHTLVTARPSVSNQKLSAYDRSVLVLKTLSDNLDILFGDSLVRYVLDFAGLMIQVVAESLWLKAKRPYYKLHPTMVPAFQRMKLDVTWDQLGARQIEPFVIELQARDTTEKYIRSILVYIFDPANVSLDEELLVKLGDIRTRLGAAVDKYPILFMAVDYNEQVDVAKASSMLGLQSQMQPKAEHTYLHFPLLPDRTLEEVLEMSIESAREHVDRYGGMTPVDDQLTRDALKIAIMTLAVRDDTELVSPEVLAKDVAKFRLTGDKSLVDKAVRNGKRGFLIGGSHASPVPHFRRMHFAWRWYGPDKKQKRIVRIARTLVKRDKVTEIPQGRHDA